MPILIVSFVTPGSANAAVAPAASRKAAIEATRRIVEEVVARPVLIVGPPVSLAWSSPGSGHGASRDAQLLGRPKVDGEIAGLDDDAVTLARPRDADKAVA